MRVVVVTSILVKREVFFTFRSLPRAESQDNPHLLVKNNRNKSQLICGNSIKAVPFEKSYEEGIGRF